MLFIIIVVMVMARAAYKVNQLFSKQYLCPRSLIKNLVVTLMHICSEKWTVELATKLLYWQWHWFQCQWQTISALSKTTL